ncbi:MAG: PAS domain-containing sensor histidine kinase [Campylobacterota bacterium]|nr:PAS domain-containing sensor histidine kinase [Campylobacterota bacterium]
MFENLKQNISLIKESKINIMQSWISNSDVLRVLKKYNIAKEIFIQKYAFGIFDYYICVLEDKCEIGDCPVIEKLLEFLKDKNIGSDELFVICAGFKNALIEFMYDKEINSLAIQKEIIYVYERNFEGVLKKYTKTIQEMDKSLNVSKHLIDENIIMSTTDLKGIITNASTAFCEISGYTLEELKGQPHNIVRHPDMPKKVFEHLWDTISKGKVWRGEVKNLRKDKNIYWVDATIAPEYDKNNNHIGYSAIRHDITYKKEVSIQQDIIVEQAKSTALGEMISMLAHQWRQPLQAIAILIQKLPLEKLIDGDVSDETLENAVSSIDQQLSYMSKTIEDFRSFFNPSKDKEKIYASALIELARDFLAYSFKVDDVHFNVIYKNDIEINIHVNEILQVFINILNNAKEALLENIAEDRKITVEFYKAKDNIVFDINDNAGGIPSIIMNKIFEPYFSTKKNKNGTGLGLYMSKTIVEKNANGILSVENIDSTDKDDRQSSGATFKIVLPIN